MVKTKSGFEIELSKDRLNNYELLEAVSEIDEDPSAITRVLKLLLGKEDTNRLKDHIRTEDGIVPADKLTDEITEMFQSMVETKNS
ncbi:hypothetical protein LHA31_02525 [Carnobacterium viridans]|uniref:Phage protein n=1 Tax=Carnobacterium viridans TaxID=174587 RepID=A0A1H1BS23_9LACT|nr:hypothetical protein [Carnobacterium viridans]UDE95672.1 hypothetical protein LHA31_02525 [Carnobacterium viridans]SDQ54741.1 hypothetical protein SAMN04487752_2715 [Carnobacterium viridans]